MILLYLYYGSCRFYCFLFCFFANCESFVCGKGEKQKERGEKCEPVCVDAGWLHDVNVTLFETSIEIFTLRKGF